MDLGIPGMHAAWLAARTILIKEWLYHTSKASLIFIYLNIDVSLAIKVAYKRKFSILTSNVVHHRIDSLSAIVTMAAIVGVNAIKSTGWLNPVSGLLICVMVIHVGYCNTKFSLYELIGRSSLRRRFLFCEREVAVAMAGIAVVETETVVAGLRSFCLGVSVAMMMAMQGRPSKPFLPRLGPTENSTSCYEPEGDHSE